MQPTRVILYHNQSTSARLRFLRFSYNSVCGFESLPELAELMDDGDTPMMAVHPAAIIKEVEEKLGLATGDLQAEGEYRAIVDVAGGPVNILLARFTSIDPPFELAKNSQATFIDLTEARDLPQVELQLLRKVYELVIGD